MSRWRMRTRKRYQSSSKVSNNPGFAQKSPVDQSTLYLPTIVVFSSHFCLSSMISGPENSIFDLSRRHPHNLYGPQRVLMGVVST